MYAFYSSASEFYVAGDHTSEFTEGRRVKMDCGVDGIRYTSVYSSSYSSPSTYITISGSNVTSNITDVWLGLVQPGSTGSLPDHYHTSTAGDGGDIQILINANTDLIAIGDAYLQGQINDTVSGIDVFIDNSVASGTIYQFVTTVSGDLQSQIDNLDAFPDQTGHAGEALYTDGASPYWASVSGTGGSGSGPSSPYGTKWIPAGAMAPATSSGASAGTNEYSPNYINMDYYAFDASVEETCEFDIVFDEEWDLGTLKAKFYWSSATGSTTGDTVTWKILGAKITNDGTLGNPTLGTAQVIDDALTANNGIDLQITSATPAITVGGTPALNDMIHFKVSRTVSGTLSEDAWLLGVLIQFHKDSVGTAW